MVIPQPINDDNWSSADYLATKDSGWFFFLEREPPYFKLIRFNSDGSHNGLLDYSKDAALELATQQAMDGNLFADKALRLYEQRGGVPLLPKECPW